MHRTISISFTLLFCFLISLISCGGSTNIPNLPLDENTDRFTFAASDKTRDQSPAVPESELDALADGNTEFACDLYRELKSGDGNIFFSPFSISQALAMTWIGARGNTETQIADTMHFTLPQNKLHPAFNKLDIELQSRGEGAMGKDSEPFRLNIANSTWGQDGWSWLPAFLDTLAVNYGAGMRLVDFMTRPDECRIIINDWVEDRTEGRIIDLLPEGIITPDTTLVLVNAIYFNAAWFEPFEEENTYTGAFTLLDHSEIHVPLMEQGRSHRYSDGDGFKAVEIMYDGRELSMLILLPEIDRFDEIESNLDAAMINGIIDDLGERHVSLILPKFEFDSKFSLKDTLYDMGMTDAFEGGAADFSGMDGSRMLFISEVLHKAFVSVDEAGTEAAAATAVIMPRESIPEPAEFHADHPFIFFIRDNLTGAILFIGRVLDPTA
ncbi:serpin family protein [bacterium]|nr:serpin family protein [bacterium]